MATTLGQRLKQAMKAANISAAELARAVKTSEATISNWVLDRVRDDQAKAALAIAIAKRLSVRVEWLLLGEGRMSAVSSPDADAVPVRAYAQAVGLGAGAEAQEYAEVNRLWFKASSFAKKHLHADQLHIMYGSGDSMLPRIRTGDAILFDEGDTIARDGVLYVIVVDGSARAEYQVKRALLLDDVVYFAADNANGDHAWKKPQRMDAKRHPIKIIGRVRWIGSWED